MEVTGIVYGPAPVGVPVWTTSAKRPTSTTIHEPAGIVATEVNEVAAAAMAAEVVVAAKALDGVASSSASMVSLSFTCACCATDNSQSVILQPGYVNACGPSTPVVSGRRTCEVNVLPASAPVL